MDDSFRTTGRSRLLPSLFLLGVLDSAVALLPRSPVLMFSGLILVMFYVAYLVLVTREIVEDVERLSPVDRLLCRWSGILALGIAVGLIALARALADGREPEETWIGSRLGMFTIKFAMEVGFILSLVCWSVPRNLRHVRPRLLWRLVTLPLLLIYGKYVIMLPISQLVGDCDRKAPRTSPTESETNGANGSST